MKLGHGRATDWFLGRCWINSIIETRGGDESKERMLVLVQPSYFPLSDPSIANIWKSNPASQALSHLDMDHVYEKTSFQCLFLLVPIPEWRSDDFHMRCSVILVAYDVCTIWLKRSLTGASKSHKPTSITCLNFAASDSLPGEAASFFSKVASRRSRSRFAIFVRQILSSVCASASISTWTGGCACRFSCGRAEMIDIL